MMPLDDIGERIARSNGLLIGSPTINQTILLQIFQVFALINPIRDRGKLAAAFGSYGWSGEAEKIIIANIESLKLKYLGEAFFTKFTPHQPELEKAYEYGTRFGGQLLKLLKDDKTNSTLITSFLFLLFALLLASCSVESGWQRFLQEPAKQGRPGNSGRFYL
jgi:hypothetical protein